MSKPTLTISPDHVYTLHRPGHPDEILPSNTQILQDRGCIDPRWYTPESAARGTYVHAVTSLWDAARLKGNDINWDEIPSAYRGYCEAWRKFVREMEFVPILNEYMLWHSSGYATTLDRYGYIGGSSGAPEGMPRYLIELKTGRPAKWVWLQLALQELALMERSRDGIKGVPPINTMTARPIKIALWLKEDGNYQVFEGSMPTHFEDARAHVRSYHSAKEYK